jgi:hypothetical protein
MKTYLEYKLLLPFERLTTKSYSAVKENHEITLFLIEILSANFSVHICDSSACSQNGEYI